MFKNNELTGSEIQGGLLPLNDVIDSDKSLLKESLDNHLNSFNSTNNNQHQNSSQTQTFSENNKTNILRAKPNQNETNTKIAQKEVVPKSDNTNNLNSMKENQKVAEKEIMHNFKNLSIDNINRIEINFPKIENKNLSNEKKNVNEQNANIGEGVKILENIYNIGDLKLKKLKDLVRKKINKTREKMHIKFIKYYYNALYIQLNWYVYVVNQLNYYQNLYKSSNNNYNTYYTTNYTTVTQAPSQSNNPVGNSNNKESNSEANNTSKESETNKNKISNNQNSDDTFKESLMDLNKLNEAISNEAEEKKKLEKKKHLKDLILKKLKERKNQFHQMFTKFYYQGKLVEQSNKKNNENNSVSISGKNDENENNIEEDGNKPTKLRAKRNNNPAIDRRNKARNLRKLMMKKEKEKNEALRKYFYRFHSNGMLFALKRNAKSTFLITKTLKGHFGKEVPEERVEKVEENKEEEKELTYLDKKRLEMQRQKEELEQKRIEALKIIIFKKDRQIAIVKRKTLEKWNLRAKIFSIEGIRSREVFRSVRFKKRKFTKSIRSKTQGKLKKKEEKEE